MSDTPHTSIAHTTSSEAALIDRATSAMARIKASWLPQSDNPNLTDTLKADFVS